MDTCVICLELLATATRTLQCGHVFHRLCIDNALAVTAATCPLCRYVVPGAAAPQPLVVPLPRHGRTAHAVDRHHLLQRLDRIDRMISLISGRIREMPEQFEGVSLAGAVREMREVRALLRPRQRTATRPILTAVVPPRRVQELPPRSSRRVARASRAQPDSLRIDTTPEARPLIPAVGVDPPPPDQRPLLPSETPPHREPERV